MKFLFSGIWFWVYSRTKCLSIDALPGHTSCIPNHMMQSCFCYLKYIRNEVYNTVTLAESFCKHFNTFLDSILYALFILPLSLWELGNEHFVYIFFCAATSAHNCPMSKPGQNYFFVTKSTGFSPTFHTLLVFYFFPLLSFHSRVWMQIVHMCTFIALHYYSDYRRCTVDHRRSIIEPGTQDRGGTTWTGDLKCKEVKTGFWKKRSMRTGSSETLIGCKSGKISYVPLWNRLEWAIAMDSVVTQNA
jgi:hypothetical protein